MGQYLGDFAAGAIVRGDFNTRAKATGAPITLAGTPSLVVYKDGSVSETTAGVTLTVDFDGVTGSHLFAIDTSADAFYTTGSDYRVKIAAGTVDGESVVGVTVGRFSIQNRFIRSEPPTAAANASQVRTELATELARIDATISSRSTFAGGPVASVTAPVTVGTNNDKTGYGLTSGERDAIAVEVESHLLDEGDSQMLINAIVGAIGNTNIDQVVLVAAIRADLERSGGNLNTLITRIAGNIRTATEDATAETAQTTAVRSGLALEATSQAIKGKTDTLPASPASTQDVQPTINFSPTVNPTPVTVNPTELSAGSVNNIRSGLATSQNVTDAQSAITTAIPNADAIATRLLSNPANKLLTNESGFVTATNGGAVVSPEAQTVTFSAISAGNPVSGVSIRVAGREVVTLTNGQRSIPLDPGNYTATIIVPPGYQEVAPQSFTVATAAVTVSLALTATAVTTPATAPLTNVQLPTEDQFGTRKAGVTVKFTFLSHAAGATITGTIVNTPGPKTSDSDGICRVTLRRLANYKAEYTIPGDRAPKTVLFTTGNTGTDTVVDD